MMRMTSAIRSGVSMTTVSSRDASAELERAVAVRGLLPWKPQIAPQRWSTAGTGPAQLPGDRPVDGPAVLGGPLRGVDHQLLPHRHAVVVRRGKSVRRLDELSVALAHAHPLQCDQWAVQESPELGQHLSDALARADRDDHHRGRRHSRPKNRARSRSPCAVPSTPSSAVAAGEPAPVQQIADGDEGRHPPTRSRRPR